MPPLKLPFGPVPDLTARHSQWQQRLAKLVNDRRRAVVDRIADFVRLPLDRAAMASRTKSVAW
jgi:hypothetical protein